MRKGIAAALLLGLVPATAQAVDRPGESVLLKPSDLTPQGVIKLSFGKKRHVLLKPA